MKRNEQLIENTWKVEDIYPNLDVFYKELEEAKTQSKELLKLGLNVPMITQISMLLNKGGFNISPYSVSVQETVEQILKVLDKKKEVG